jgi:hypothetical protein
VEGQPGGVSIGEATTVDVSFSLFQFSDITVIDAEVTSDAADSTRTATSSRSWGRIPSSDTAPFWPRAGRGPAWPSSRDGGAVHFGDLCGATTKEPEFTPGIEASLGADGCTTWQTA